MKEKIKIERAMLCWNDMTKKVGVMAHPAVNFREQGYCSDVGAKSHEQWKSWPDDKKVSVLLAEGYDLILRRGLQPRDVFESLCQIEECAEILINDPFL